MLNGDHRFLLDSDEDYYAAQFQIYDYLVDCDGTESSWSDCPIESIGNSCSHYNDLVVECQPHAVLTPITTEASTTITSSTVTTQSPSTTSIQASTNTVTAPAVSTTALPIVVTTSVAVTTVDPRPVKGRPDIRLSNTGGLYSGARGLLEIKINETWGTVCDSKNGWSEENAEVVCKQLEYV